MSIPEANYPTSFADIGAWATANGLSAAEARVRFAQYAILHSIGSSAALRGLLVFKGGNALDFVWQPNRSTRDLDFSTNAATIDVDEFRNRLGRALEVAGRDLNVTLVVNNIVPDPRRPDSTFVTYKIGVGYVLQDQANLRSSLARGARNPQVVRVELSMNEVICAEERVSLGGNRTIRVCTLEDIVAEKLRALLQQPVRNRHRPQDLLDIAFLLRSGATPDPEHVARYLIQKAQARNITATRASFDQIEVIERSRLG